MSASGSPTGVIEVDLEQARLMLQSQLADERSEALVLTELSYAPGHPVRIRIRRREHRYDIDDMGAAVALAGRLPGWEEAAALAVEAHAWNINRDGVVLMHAVEGRDIDALVRRTAEASVAVFDAVLEAGEQSEGRRPAHR